MLHTNVKGVERNKEIFKQIYKVAFKTFICHVKGAKGSITYINRMKPLPQYVHTDKVLYCSGFSII